MLFLEISAGQRTTSQIPADIISGWNLVYIKEECYGNSRNMKSKLCLLIWPPTDLSLIYRITFKIRWRYSNRSRRSIKTILECCLPTNAKLSVPVGDKGRVEIFVQETAGDDRGNVVELIPQTDEYIKYVVNGLCPKDDTVKQKTLDRIMLYSRAMGRMLVYHWPSLVLFMFFNLPHDLTTNNTRVQLHGFAIMTPFFKNCECIFSLPCALL